MKIFLFPAILFLLLAFTDTKAQNIQFVENKGQWDSRVKFRGEMNIGTFFLEKDGYRILLNNSADVDKLNKFYHGELNSKSSATARSVTPSSDSLVLRSHVYEVKFLGASDSVTVIPDKPLSAYNNYFIGNDHSKWASHCQVYQAVTYKNIYPGVDARYYTDNGNLKYNLIVNPGGDVSKIVLQFNGADGLSIKKGNLIIKTSVGDVTELAPATYQLTEKGKQAVNVSYVIKGNTVSFKLSNLSYSKNAAIIIDPTLVFSTFTGSRVDNWGYTATYDGAGNFYAGGIAFAQGYDFKNIGGYQTQYHGGDQAEGAPPYDAAIIKFDPTGHNAFYATYLGGSGDDQPHSLVADNNGNLIIAGRTHFYVKSSASKSDFPQTQPPFGPCGDFDIFIAKLSADGTILLGSRLFGGTGSDGVNIEPKYITTLGEGAISTRRNYGDDARSEVILDASDNIYLASSTRSNDFPLQNAFQNKLGNDTLQDGVVIKTNPDLSQVYLSSFLGGSDNDAAFVLALNPINNNLYVGGATASSDFPGINNLPFSPNSSISSKKFHGGITDGFISIINNTNYSLVKSVYIGTSGNDMLYGIQFDRYGYPYVMGTTTSAFPVSNAAFTNQSYGKQYITKLNSNLDTVIYSTNFGSKNSEVPNISPTAFLVDRCENVYVSGWGGEYNQQEQYPNAGTTGLSITANAIQNHTDGSDFYFFVLEKNALSQLYGSFFGQNGGFTDHVDGGTSRFDKEGVIYQGICANCGGTVTFPTTPGVWSQNNGTVVAGHPGCNMAAVKIAFELAGVGSGVRASINGIPRDTSGCVPLTVDFADTLQEGKTYIWSFDDGTKDDTTTKAIDTHTFINIGNYHVRLISVDSSTCNISDTSYTNIRAGNKKALLSFTAVKLPPCTSLNYQFTNTSVAPPGVPFGPQSFTWFFGDGDTSSGIDVNPTHSYASPGIYFASLSLSDTNYCNSPGKVIDTLRIAENVKAQFDTPPFGCAPYTAIFNNTSLAGQQFFWDFGDGSPVSTAQSPTHLYNIPGTYIVKLLALDSSTCNKADSTSFTIIVSPKPAAVFTYSPVSPKANTAITFINSSTDGTHYKWIFGDGDSLLTVELDTTVAHIYNKTGTFNVCLIAYNDYGCTDTACQPVQAIIIPLLDVPNAFTPNGDGVNDYVHVRGFGIDKLNWRIYNRWGTLVFQSTNQNDGWDGKYKGALQPQEVYTYVLDVLFTDGTKYRKTGDITLLR